MANTKSNVALSRLYNLPEYQEMPEGEKEKVKNYVLILASPQQTELDEGKWEIAWEALNDLYPVIFGLLNTIYYESLEHVKEVVEPAEKTPSYLVPEWANLVLRHEKDYVCGVCGKVMLEINKTFRICHGYSSPVTMFACSYDHALILERRRGKLNQIIPHLKEIFWFTEETDVILEVVRREQWNEQRRQTLLKQCQWGTGHMVLKTHIPDGFIYKERHSSSVCPCGRLETHSHELIQGTVWDVPSETNPD
jgi:hypothetical protein